MTELHLFAGAGGGILGGMLLGHTTVAAVEIEPFCQEVLRARQADGLLPNFPIFGDIRGFDGRPWRGRVDVVAGGFPCQDVSVAGRGAGLAGERSGLWSEFARVIGEVRPRFAFIENSPALVGRGLDRVLSDLAALGMDARWCVLGADDAGAPHQRKRIWILGIAKRDGRQAGDGRRAAPDSQWNGAGAEPGRQQQPARAGGASAVADAERPERGAGDSARGAGREQLLPPGEESAVRSRGGSQAMADADTQRRNRRAGEPGAGRRGESAHGCSWLPNTDCPRLAKRRRIARDDGAQLPPAIRACDGLATGRTEPGMGRMAHGLAPWVDRSNTGGMWASDPADEGRMGRTARGVPRRVARLKALGNGQVPQVAALAWRVLTAGLEATP